MMETGETTIIIRSGYKISYLRPCGEEGKLIAEGNIEKTMGIDAMKPLLEKRFSNVNTFPKMKMIRFEKKGLSVLLYENGDLVVRKIKNLIEAIDVAEAILDCLNDL